jgi:hypothetical protein
LAEFADVIDELTDVLKKGGFGELLLIMVAGNLGNLVNEVKNLLR